MTALESRMVLHSFMCEQFGYPNLRDMLDRLDGLSDQLDETEQSVFFQALKLHLPNTASANIKDLARYDENIADYSRHLGMTAERGRTWKPFQYVALLFTERYLDLYFSDPEALLTQLNKWQKSKWHRTKKKTDIPYYTADDLRTLAFQSATGSGKTLLLHANILQYKHYLKTHKKLHILNKIILVTPDEGLSRQHLAELEASKIPAQLFSDNARMEVFSHAGAVVDIIDLHKLADKKGVKRVALESFEGNNLVLVDEGHLGVGGTKWRNHRKTLANNGFTFEYSATFNQAVSGNGKGIPELRDEYGKSILFDYSYKFFYEDGYGKDYQISNLPSTDDQEANDIYLLACLLMFYQQCRIYEEHGGQWREFNIAPPLWVFLGRTVTGGTRTSDEKETETDVIRIVKFLAWVQSRKNEVVRGIATLLSDDTGLKDEGDADIFKDSFPSIKNAEHEKIYDQICQTVFHAHGQLQVSHLSGTDELQISAGDSTPFGVINVGDASGLYTKLSTVDDPLFTISKNAFTRPLFATVDNDNSTVTVVIGARKFAAGWNSWRVSTMGLMHVGRSEGPQIIQMFGRGVRLKGHEMSLKRHSALGMTPPNKDQLKLLETLNIFGLKADYMDKFKEYLKNEGVKVNRVTYTLKTKNQLENITDLKVIQKKASAGEYECSGERVALVDSSSAPEENSITLDFRKPVEFLRGEEDQVAERVEVNDVKLEPEQIKLLNQQTIYHKVLERKRRFGWHNMEISPEMVDKLLNNTDWYSLYIHDEKLKPLHYGRVREWEGIAADLIAEYAKQRWQNKRRVWEHEHLEAVALDDKNPNYVKKYELSVDAKETALIQDIEELIERIKAGDYSTGLNSNKVQVSIFDGEFHAFIPLLYANSNDVVKITPLPLNSGEKEFVDCLRNVLKDKENLDFLRDKEVYLMRNQSRGKGIHFFSDVAFYPDFILWAKDGNQQHILFIDPKGLAHYNHKTEAKVSLHKKIKETQSKIQEKNPELRLHNYIWSQTRPEDIGTDEKMSYEECHEKGIYISSISHELEKLLEHALTSA